MKALLNNRGMAILAFGALLGVSCLAAVYPSNFPTAAKSYDAAMVGNIAWMLVASSMVLLMTPGLAFFYGGMVSKKNIISTMLQSFIALGIVSLLWFFVGFSLAFGDDVGGWGIIGNPATFFMFNNVGTEAHPTSPDEVRLRLREDEARQRALRMDGLRRAQGDDRLSESLGEAGFPILGRLEIKCHPLGLQLNFVCRIGVHFRHETVA